jgi:hypothetical protein
VLVDTIEGAGAKANGKPQAAVAPDGRFSNGILYLAIGAETGPGDDVIAIQTTSPGLAPSAWPVIRHDNRGTMWLVDANSSINPLPAAGPSQDSSPPDVPMAD